MSSQTEIENRFKHLYKEYVENGGVISPMNTETYRRYLQNKTGMNVEPEDVLRLFYNRLDEMKAENSRSTSQ